MIPAQRLEQAAAYALGAMDPSEIAGFEAELARSQELRHEVEELQRVTGFMAASVAQTAPPPRLRDRIMTNARAAGRVAAVRSEPRATAAPTSTRRSALAIVPWLLAAAAVAGVVVMRGRAAQERDQRIALTQVTDSMRIALAARDSVLATLLAPDVETVKLVATGKPPSARLYWNRATNQVILAAFSLPPAPSGRTYQLWGIAGANAKPVSLGTFNTGANGEGRLAAAVPPGLTIAVGAVTEEPAGGSPQPTTQPFMVGQVRAGQ
jgi:anti-sigma-K factor RskA